jgi:muramoyltetrapeptide carboxypeptidase
MLRCAQGRFPVITGVGFGHQQSKIIFPVGCRLEFDMRGQHPVLRYLEDLVALDAESADRQGAGLTGQC